MMESEIGTEVWDRIAGYKAEYRTWGSTVAQVWHQIYERVHVSSRAQRPTILLQIERQLDSDLGKLT